MGNTLCTERYWAQLRQDITTLEVGSVVVAARWPFDFTQDDYDTAITNLSGLGLEIFLIQSLPEGQSFNPTFNNANVYGDVRFENEVYATYDRQRYLADRTNQILAFETIKLRKNVEILWVADVICPDQFCLFAKDGTVIYKDDNHVSEAGADILRPSIEPLFR
jgi:hypothetical protein